MRSDWCENVNSVEGMIEESRALITVRRLTIVGVEVRAFVTGALIIVPVHVTS